MNQNEGGKEQRKERKKEKKRGIEAAYEYEKRRRRKP